MAFLDLFRRKGSEPLGAVIRAYFGGTSTKSGVEVSAESAMRCSTVYTCVSVLSESVAQLPCLLYRRTPDGGKERATDHPLYELLHDRPNGWQTAFEFWEGVVSHMALYGNAYAYIVRGARGQPTELIPLMPWQVSVRKLPDHSLEYRIPDGSGTRVVGAKEVFHCRYRTLDGVTGVSPITYNRETVGLAMAALNMGAEVFGSGATVAGVLSIPGSVGDEALKRIAEAWNSRYHGPDRGQKTAVLDNGAQWKPVAMTAEDAQYIETRKLQRGEIAAIFRVPPHKVGDMEHATFSNIEHQSIEFVRETLAPWLKRIEQAIARDLIGGEPLFAEFLIDGLLRGDSAGRASLYRELFATGAISPNEIRDRENMNRIGEQGDARYVPANLMPLGAASAKDAANA